MVRVLVVKTVDVVSRVVVCSAVDGSAVVCCAVVGSTVVCCAVVGTACVWLSFVGVDTGGVVASVTGHTVVETGIVSVMTVV